ncbi:MAG TPA: efflux RND transporter permease subunit [Gemmatimonadaceae bacterium]|nr:efflux RND transporter permease subunit [Gemmatimonadaceae bacterium]
MFISDFAIRKPLITVVAMVTLVVFGLFALLKLKTDEFPDVAPPVVTMGIPYPGASPEGVAKEILDPIEEQISSISGVKHVYGHAYDGYGFIMVEFQFGKDLMEATQDLRDAVSIKRADLPTEMKEPIIQKFNDTDRPIVSLALSSSTLNQAELTRLADPTITRELRSIPGVAEVAVSGKVERELTVELRPSDMQAAGVSVSQVVQALQLQNLAAPVGRVTGDMDERSIRLKGRIEQAQDFAQLVVAERNGQLIRLGQIANVRDGTEEPRTLALYNDREAVGIDVKKSKGYSTTEVSDKVRERVQEIEKTLDKGTSLELVKDSGVRVDHAVRNVEEALLEGAVLTVLVVFLFLNSWRSTVITGLALPVSVLASFIAVWVMGFKLETMSLLGLSLAIGILIDDAIVVRENIVRHVEMGKDHYTASREGTDEIGLAVAATTFSILAVFIPIGFMPGVGGQWFKPFALTIACSVFVSLFVSFSLDPMLSAYWSDPHVPEEKKAWITKKLDRFNAWFNRQAQSYRKVIAWALDHRSAMVALAIGTFFASFTLFAGGVTGLLAAFVGLGVLVFALTSKRLGRLPRIGVAIVGLALFVGLPKVVEKSGLAARTVGVGFFPSDDQAELTISLETPPGSNMAYTRLKAQEAARITRQHKEVRYTYTTLGGGANGTVDEGNIYVRLVPKTDRDMSAEDFAAMLRNEMKQVGGVTLAVFTSDFGGGQKQLQFQLKGHDLAALNVAADQVLQVVKATPGAVDVGLSTKGQKPELEVDLDRGMAGTLGVTVGQVAQSLRPAFAGIEAGNWQDPSGEMRKVQVRLVPEARRNAEDLRQLPLVVLGPNGVPTTMPLGQVATVTQGTGPAIIDHLDRDLVVTVEANTSGRASGDVTADVQKRVAKLTLPPGVTMSLGGDAQAQQEVFGQIFFALGVAVLLMYLVLVVQFGSFLDPLAILMSLPLSLIGVLLALAISNMTVNLMSLIGVILLMGIVAKNAILLIDFAKWAREKEGMPLREALIEAGAIRLRPILMTTFALIAGMVPVAIGRGEGAQFRAPLGMAIIGGVLTSTLLTLLVIPTFYEVMDEWRHALARRFGFTPPMTAEHPIPDALPALGD